jgi:hypothetical protein
VMQRRDVGQVMSFDQAFDVVPASNASARRSGGANRRRPRSRERCSGRRCPRRIHRATAGGWRRPACVTGIRGDRAGRCRNSAHATRATWCGGGAGRAVCFRGIGVLLALDGVWRTGDRLRFSGCTIRRQSPFRQVGSFPA